MATRLQQWIDFLYGPIFRVIGFFYRIYKANRGRVASLTERKKIASLLQNGAVILLIAWLLIWFFASDESRSRLTEEVQESIGNLSAQPEE
ncbi:MAG: hypothetical protein O6649_08565 [Gammaproteobacteria bacterium]|nr:hypothetical protein [Gammaproteobacteria bacterium]MCZ6488741.1 hypothetical protein [Gammaproteobacteria bacterium]MCZ6669211.1 hypothetical protein [Gammaproteobacteria bacterium]